MFDGAISDDPFYETIEIIFRLFALKGHPLAHFRIIDFLKSPGGLICHFSSFR
jgi:hypothetical protein